MQLKSIKKITPDYIKGAYHKVRAFVAAAKYRFPAKKMIVIGITGTKGKTSTGNYIWSVLTAGGYKTGLVSSAIFRIGDVEEINSHHMTMPDPFLIQQKLHQMHQRGVEVAIVEMTSEGMKQHRHTGIPVDVAVFTNLTPEHLTSHKGSFEKYKQAKSPLFRNALRKKARHCGELNVVPTILANADSEHSEYYLGFQAPQKYTYGLEGGDFQATNITAEKTKTIFSVDTEEFSLAIPGIFNIYNALPALIVGQLFGISKEKIRTGLASLSIIPGRMEIIDEGQKPTVIVDYAHEPASLGALLGAAEKMKGATGKIILLIGVIGGGREPRTPLARLAAKGADYVIITNEDPYDEDPERLIKELTKTAEEHGKKVNKNLFPILDRREGIRKALALAGEDDIVLIAGKGAETTMMTKIGAIPWDERAIVRQLVREL